MHQLQTQQSQIHLQNTLQSMQVLLLNIQSESKLQNEHIKNTQNAIASQKALQEQQFQWQLQSARRVSLHNLRWDTLAFLIAWPFVANFLYSLLKSFFKK
jgi:hypothetical protein